MTTISVTGPVPTNPAGLPNAGQVGTNSAEVDETTQAGATYIACVLYAINYRNTIPDPAWTPTIPDPNHEGQTIPNPTPQGQVAQTQAPGLALMIALRTYVNNLAAIGAAQLEAAAVAAATAEASTLSAAVAAVNPVLQ